MRAGGYLLALVTVVGFFVWSATGQRWENDLTPPPTNRREFSVRSELLEPAKTVLGVFGDVWVIGAILLALVLVALVSGRTRFGWVGVGLVACSVGGARLLKELVPRPDFDVVHSTTHNSFPSGHAATAMGLLCAWLMLSRRAFGGGWRSPEALVCQWFPGRRWSPAGTGSATSPAGSCWR